MNYAPKLEDNAVWKQRWRMLSIYGCQIAKTNPERGMIFATAEGRYQLFAWNVSAGATRQLTDHQTGMQWGTLSPDGRWVYFRQDDGGDEIGHYVRLPYEGGDPETLTSDMAPYASYAFGMSRSGNRIGFTVVDNDGSHIYIVDINHDGTVGQRKKLYHCNPMAQGPTYSFDGEIAVVASTERIGNPEHALLAFDVESGEQIGELWDAPNGDMKAVLFSPLPGDPRLLGTSNTTGVERPFIWNPVTSERDDLSLPDLDGEVRVVDWSFDGEQILLSQINQAQQQLLVYDVGSQHVMMLDHPSGDFRTDNGRGTFFTPSGEIWAEWEDAAHPPQLIALDGETGKFERTILTGADAPTGSPARSITFPSSDGETIQGWLSVPEGEGPFPTVIYMHGGPETATMNWFDPEGQMWVDHGIAFCSINYRGSTTFGREFRTKIWGNYGHWEVEDMVAARAWLVAEGITDPDLVFLHGWSYGGYLTLLGLGKYPELWAGGMAGAAITDWAVNYEDAADTLKTYMVSVFDGTPEENPEPYAASSPITHADAIQAPIFIIQGKNDTRTPPRQIEQFAERLQSQGKAIQVHWYDAGHSGDDMEEAIGQQTLFLEFVCKVLNNL